MENHQLNNEKEPTSQPELSQDNELTDEELDSVDGGLLPAVRSANSGVGGVATKPAQVGIIAIPIGL